MAIPPWFMWGSTVQLNLVVPFGRPGISGQPTGQTARIDYGRPDSFRFFFAAELLTLTGDPAVTCDITLDLDLTIGVGRSQQLIKSFEHYKFSAIPTATTPPPLLWSTEVLTPARFSGDVVGKCSSIVTQSINVQWRGTIQLNSALGANALLNLTTFFSPDVHLRPEWFKDGTFTGGENAGS